MPSINKVSIMSVRIRVKVYNVLIEKLGWKEKIVELSKEPTVRDVLEKIPSLEKILSEYEEKGFPAIIMVNGRRIEFLNGLNTKLRNCDELSIFPPSAGG